MQALLWFGSRNKSTCPLSYLSNIFVLVSHSISYGQPSIPLFHLLNSALDLSHQLPFNSIVLFFVCFATCFSLTKSLAKDVFRAWCFWRVPCITLSRGILENHRWSSCRCNRLGKWNQRWSHCCGMSFVPWHGNCLFHFRISDDIRWYQYIWVYLHSGHECLKMVGFAKGLWRAKANGQVPALKISFTQPWWGQLSGSVVGVGDSSATEYKHRLESVQN